MSRVKVNIVPAVAVRMDVCVLDLEEGDVFYCREREEFGVRVADGWLGIDNDGSHNPNIAVYIDSEIEQYRDYKQVQHRQDLECYVRIGPA